MSLLQKKSKNTLSYTFEHSHVDADSFLKGVISFVGLLKNVSDEVAGKKESLKWVISVEKGSMIVVARPEPQKALKSSIPKIVNTIHSGFMSLRKKDSRPRYFSDTSLRHARDLVIAEQSAIKDSPHRVANSEIKAAQQIIKNVESIMSIDRIEDGSVEGKVVVISDRKKFEVTIDDMLTGRAVQCIAGSKLEKKLINAFRKRVLVTGKVHYRKDGDASRIEVDEVIILEGKSLPSFEDMRGIFNR